MANIGKRELKNLSKEISMVDEEQTRWRKEKEGMDIDQHWKGEFEDIDSRLERLHLSLPSDRELRRRNRDYARIDEERNVHKRTLDPHIRDAGNSRRAEEGNTEIPDSRRSTSGIERGPDGRINPEQKSTDDVQRKSVGFTQELDYEDNISIFGSTGSTTSSVPPPSFLSDDHNQRMLPETQTERTIPMNSQGIPLDGKLRSEEADVPMARSRSSLQRREAEAQTQVNLLLREQELKDRRKQLDEEEKFRVGRLCEKEREIEVKRKRLEEEEEIIRIRSRLGELERSWRPTEEHRVREAKIKQEKEKAFEIATGQKTQINVDRLHAYEMQQRYATEAQARTDRLTNLREEERKLETNIQTLIAQEKEQRERLQHITIEGKRLEQELHKTTTTQPYRTQTYHEETDDETDWERYVNQRERQPQADRLQLLFESEKRLAQAISDEMVKKEQLQFEEEIERKRQSRNTTDLDHVPKRMKHDEHQKYFIKPTLTPFSGMEPTPRNECSFEIWALEVESLMPVYPDYLVSQAIRHSLKGEARRGLLSLSALATSQEIMTKMESVFGNVVSGESVLQQFYCAVQTDGETVTSWGLRVEEILQKAIRKGHIHPEQRNNMLRTKFWRGLRSTDLKNATRMYFESESNFEALRKKVRSEECEIQSDPRPPLSSTAPPDKAHHHQVQLNQDTSMFVDLMGRMERMERKVEQLNTPGKSSWNKANRKPDDSAQNDNSGSRLPPSQQQQRQKQQQQRQQQPQQQQQQKPQQKATLNR